MKFENKGKWQKQIAESRRMNENAFRQANEDNVIRRGKTINGDPWTETKIKEVTVNILGVTLRYDIIKFHVEMPEDKKSFSDKDRLEYQIVNQNDIDKLEKVIQNAIHSKISTNATFGSGQCITIDTHGYINK